jgi:rare lipoprotein A
LDPAETTTDAAHARVVGKVDAVFPQTQPDHNGRMAVPNTLESVLKVKLVTLVITVLEVILVTTTFAIAQSGIASVYSTKSGSHTASGAGLNPGALTAAHRSLPFGSKVRVTNRGNGRSVIVTINDRGPFVRGRIIDVTPTAALALGMSGLASVTLQRE